MKHLYHNSTLALEAGTGEIAWYYQHLIDHWDLDHPFERLLVDTELAPNESEGPVDQSAPRAGRGPQGSHRDSRQDRAGLHPRPRDRGVSMGHPDRAAERDQRYRRRYREVTENAEVIFSELGQEVLVCPTYIGGKDWQAGAYSPLTGTMYFPLQNTCGRMTATQEGRRLAIYALRAEHVIAPGTDRLGTVHAVSLKTGEAKWTYEQRAGTQSLFTSGGGLVFVVDSNGRFKALDQETGDVLWEINLGSPVTGFPISYAVDGRQYVVASTGFRSAALSTGLTPELRPSSGNNLFVFALPND